MLVIRLSSMHSTTRSRGWAVFPAPPGEKKSYKSAERSGGRKWGATTDAAEINQDFKRWPNANVGIVCGALSGIFVVEADTKEGHDVDGIASLSELEAQHGALPATLEAESPSGSVHYYFNHPGYPIKNSASVVASGVDVRGDGGMVMGVPSIKPGKGAYKWRNNLPIADCPQWLLDRIAAGKEKPEPELSISQRAAALVWVRDAFDEYADEGKHASNGAGYIEAAVLGEYDEVVRAPKGKRNAQLNDFSLKLGHYVGGGVLDEQTVINEMLRAATDSGLVAEDGRLQCLATIRSGLAAGRRQPKGIPERERTTPAPGQAAAAPPVIRATPYVWKDPTTIRRRQWLYGNLLLRKFVTATISPGGIGKSSLVTVEALAMVSGKDLLGVASPFQLRVWLWNLEDPQDETERKIQAAALHYELDPADISELLVDSGRDQKWVIAKTSREGTTICHPVVDALVAEIIKYNIDVLIIDPFVSCHEVKENDNGGMDMVVKEWGRVAELGNCAVHLVHHTRKPLGSEGETTTNSSRGASSQTDACRVVRPINLMSEKEATEAGVANRRLYFRTVNDKANLQPPAEKSDWFKLESVDLGNGEMGVDGDSVGVVTKWEFPDAMAGITGADFDKVARVIRGGKWRHHPQATAWVGNAVAEALELDIDDKAVQAKIKRMLGVWHAAKSLVVVEAEDDNRDVRKFVEVAK